MKKKKILLMSDDIRMHSGVACVSKDIIMSTIHHYDWAQIGGAINHPDEGKIIDMSESISNETGKNSYLKIYPITGYGSADLLREVLELERPDAILHYTDPRFWIWLYQMEREIRTKIPLFYYNIWDDLPDPQWNRNFYESCDLLMAISKQTYGINKRILPKYKDWQITYVPHGISSKRFFPINPNSTDFQKFKQKHNFNKYSFLILYSNRNIRRKMPGDVVLAYKHFVEQLPEDEQKKCALVFHTSPVDDNGTDLKVVCESLIPQYNVIFTHDSGGPFNDIEMNFLFNSIDIYINIASNEGFGLGSCEALTVGKPIIVNVTGGLQDQCGFQLNETPSNLNENRNYLSAEDYVSIGSLHDKEKWQMKVKCGEWVKPIWPKTLSLMGSPMTPYIFDDRCDWKDVGDAIKEWYDIGPEERERCGELGRQFVTSDSIGMHGDEMSKRFINSMDNALKNWKPRPRYTLEVV